MKSFCAVVTLISISALPVYAGKWATGTTAPATCTVGDSWTDTNGTADNRFYTCTATNTWTLNSNQTAIDTKANKSGTVMLWSEYGVGAYFDTMSPQVSYNGLLYKCINPYVKTLGEYPDTQTEYFTEVAGAGGGIAHATSDGAYYASKNGAWSNLTGVFAAPLGTDDNYVTDAEKTKLIGLVGVPTLTEGQTVIGGTGGTPTAVSTASLSRSTVSDLWSGTGYMKTDGTADAGGAMTYPGAGNIAYTSNGTTWGTMGLSTSVATPGSDAAIPTEQAVREAISAVSISAPTIQSADPTSASAQGWYAATGSGDIFYKSSAGLFTIAGTYTADAYTLTADMIDANGTDAVIVPVGGTARTTDGDWTGLSGTVNFTITPASGRTGDCVGAGISGTSPNKTADMSADRSMTCTFASFGFTETFNATGYDLTTWTESITGTSTVNEDATTQAFGGSGQSLALGIVAGAEAYTTLDTGTAATTKTFRFKMWVESMTLPVNGNNAYFGYAGADTGVVNYTGRLRFYNSYGNMRMRAGDNATNIVVDYNEWIDCVWVVTNNGSSTFTVISTSNPTGTTVTYTGTANDVRYLTLGGASFWDADEEAIFYIDNVSVD